MKKVLDGFLKSGFGTFTFLIFTVISQKIFSLYIGAMGMGLYSLMKSIYQTALQIGTLNGSLALTQGASSRENEERHAYLVTIFKIIFLASLLVSLSLLALAPWIGEKLLHESDPQVILLIRLLSLPVFLGGLNTFLSGFLNSYRLVGRLAVTLALSGFAGAFIAYPVARIVGYGNVVGLIGYMAFPLLVGVIVSIVFLFKQGLAGAFIKIFPNQIAVSHLRHFFSFGIVTFVNGLLQSFCILLVRSQVILTNGLSWAGYLEVAWSISMHYINLVALSFNNYYLPALTQTRLPEEKRKLIGDVLRISILLAAPIITGIVIFKPLFIRLLYSTEFLSAVVIMRWMLIGDFFKVTSAVLGMTIFAANDLKSLLFVETAWDGIFLLAAIGMLRLGGSIEAVGIAFVLGYIFTVGWQYIYNHRHKYFLLNWRTGLTWMSGLLLVLVSSLVNWKVQGVNLPLALGNLALIPLFFAVALSRQEWQKVFEWARNPRQVFQKIKMWKKSS